MHSQDIEKSRPSSMVRLLTNLNPFYDMAFNYLIVRFQSTLIIDHIDRKCIRDHLHSSRLPNPRNPHRRRHFSAPNHQHWWPLLSRDRSCLHMRAWASVSAGLVLVRDYNCISLSEFHSPLPLFCCGFVNDDLDLVLATSAELMLIGGHVLVSSLIPTRIWCDFPIDRLDGRPAAAPRALAVRRHTSARASGDPSHREIDLERRRRITQARLNVAAHLQRSRSPQSQRRSSMI
jgi:hypothetical protein